MLQCVCLLLALFWGVLNAFQHKSVSVVVVLFVFFFFFKSAPSR